MFSRPRMFLAAIILSLATLFIYTRSDAHTWEHTSNHLNHLPITQTGCEGFSPAEEILVIVKTGATEIFKKLPIHFKTTLRCIPHFVIFSDLDDIVEGHKVHDILASISHITKSENKDFQLYHRLHDLKAKDSKALSHDWSEDDKNKAWALDKWKFLPMIEKAYQSHPEASWFVFLETDTAIIWSNMFLWLEKLSSRKEEPMYLGAPAWIEDVMFAHGGSGIVMSNSAVRRVAEKWQQEQVALEKIAEKEWAGDRLLSMVLRSVGVELTKSWPMIQGETPSTLDYTSEHWCMPIVSYHHVTEEWVKSIADFEEESLKDKTGEPIRHHEAFEWFVQPNLVSEKQGWDNICQDEQNGETMRLEECRQACESKSSCLQWSFSSGKCKTGTVVRLGSENSQGTVSGWMLARIEAFKKAQPDPCPKDNWIVS